MSLSSVAYGNGLFVVVGLNGTILTSSNGISWTNRNSKTKVILYEVTYGNGLFIAVGEQGIILSSEDGRNWRKTITRKTANLHGVTYHDGLYVTVGYDYGAKGGSFVFISLEPAIAKSSCSLYSQDRTLDQLGNCCVVGQAK